LKLASNEDFSRFLENNFLIRDAAPIQFSKSRTALLYSDNTEVIIDHYLKLYFPEEKNHFEAIPASKEYSQVDRFRSILLSNNLDINLSLKKGELIKNEKATFKPDLVWENGSTNLIKEVNFNDTSEDKIRDKALLLSNKLNYLSDEIRAKNSRVDFFVTRPLKESLISSYEVALDILNDARVPKTIVTENELKNYSINAVIEIKSHLLNS